MFARRFVIGAAAVLCAAAATAQTHGQWLERAIFAEDTAGDLDAAIRIYEQLVSASAVPPEILARAQSRLSDGRRRQDQTLRATAAGQQSTTPRGLPGQIDPPPAAPRTTPSTGWGMFWDFYDQARPVSVVGLVTEVQWSNPNVVVYLKESDGKLWGFILAPPNSLTRSGMSRDSIKVGEQLQAQGVLAKGEGANCPAPLPTACATLPNGAIHASGRQLIRMDGSGNVVPNTGQPAGAGSGRGGRGGVPR